LLLAPLAGALRRGTIAIGSLLFNASAMLRRFAPEPSCLAFEFGDTVIRCMRSTKSDIEGSKEVPSAAGIRAG
jgi:hypothetical protein